MVFLVITFHRTTPVGVVDRIGRVDRRLVKEEVRDPVTAKVEDTTTHQKVPTTRTTPTNLNSTNN